MFAVMFAVTFAAGGCLVTLPELGPESVDCSGASGTVACDGKCVSLAEDPHNCGACGHDCGGQACRSRACDLGVVPGPWALATSPGDGFIYGTEGHYTAKGVRLFKFAKNCGADVPCKITEAEPDHVGGKTEWLRQRHLVVDEDAVYWTNIGQRKEDEPVSVMSSSGTVWRMPKSDPSKVCASPQLQERPYGLALAPDGYLYWSNLLGGIDGGGELVRVKKNELCTATPQRIAPTSRHNVGPLAIVPKPSGPSSYFLVWGSRNQDDANRSRGVYRIEPNASAPASTLFEIASLTAASKNDAVTDLKVLGKDIYFRYGRAEISITGDVRRAAMDAAGSRVLHQATDPRQLTADQTHLYWTDGTPPSRIVRAPLAGGPAETVVNADSPQALLLDGPYLYFGEFNTGFVRRLRVKP